MALEFLTQKLKAYTGKEVAVIPSAQTSCEDSFVFHRFARDVLKTRNIVSPSGVSPLEAAGRIGQKTGVWFPLNFRFEEVECARVILVVGADPAESHPILWLHILKAVRGGADLVFVGPAAPIGLRHVSLWLQTHPGTEDIVCDFLAKRLIEKGHGKKKEDMAGFSSYRRAVGRMALSQVVSSTGVSPGVVDQAVERLSKGGVFIVAGAGLTQFPSGERNLVSLWNLGLLVNSRVFLLGLESNSRGMFEIQKGLALRVKSMEKIREAIRSGQVKAIYAAGPLPLGKKDKVEFLIIQDSYMSEAAERADVVLPAATFAESAGTFVNAEGRIQSFPAVVPPRGEAKPDWWILTRLAERRGRKDFRYPRVADIRRDIKTLLPGFRKLSLSGRRRRQPVFIQEESKPQERFLPLQPREPGVKTSRSYPFLLWAEYGLDSYRNLVLAHEVKGLRIIRNPRWFRIHPEDAQKAGIEDGQTVEVLSRLGKTRGIGKVSTAVPRGVITAHLLWGEASEFSLVPHVSSPAQASSSISLIPVNIKRGE
ncbi:MAG: molybdopterin oxidoreductase family protein [Candidatus Aminicenantales bacterium]